MKKLLGQLPARDPKSLNLTREYSTQLLCLEKILRRNKTELDQIGAIIYAYDSAMECKTQV